MRALVKLKPGGGVGAGPSSASRSVLGEDEWYTGEYWRWRAVRLVGVVAALSALVLDAVSVSNQPAWVQAPQQGRQPRGPGLQVGHTACRATR